MFERLKILYKSGRLKETHLSKAVSKGWITEAQKDEIISDNLPENGEE